MELPAVPETRVLAIASHVGAVTPASQTNTSGILRDAQANEALFCGQVVYGYVGNTMAVFVMQALGCEVAALNTVQYSNHTGYGQFRGFKTSAAQISEVYEGLKDSYLDDFDVMLSGYIPGAEAVKAVGGIAADLKRRAKGPGSFFWVLDPVMGDEGRLYVNEDVVPAYKGLLHMADMILPNQFEAEILSGIKIDSLPALKAAITTLHVKYHIPHIIITSLRLPNTPKTLTVVGSTFRSDASSRLFRIDIPAIDCFFSGTGDMFAALTVARFREAAATEGLCGSRSWVSEDDIEAVRLPLAKAAEKVLASMCAVLVKTKERRDRELVRVEGAIGEEGGEKMLHLKRTKAAEVQLVRNLQVLREPRIEFFAQALDG
ncbi:MAG: putative pyridoxal kinase [Geoglossum umbratile]|nr:MAG: putative pyridoxal kinase [Geoglossum umbratile]